MCIQGIRYPPRTSKQQLSIGKMDNFRAKKKKQRSMRHAKTDSDRHIDNINKYQAQAQASLSADHVNYVSSSYPNALRPWHGDFYS